MKIAVTYSVPGAIVLEGHIIGSSPVVLGELFMQLADGKVIAVDSEFVNEK